jgi:hypothetical protein
MNRLLRRQALPLALATALAATAASPATAQSDRERELEARIAELEKAVQMLLAEREQAAAQPEPVRKPAPPAQPVQNTTITPGANPGTTFAYGGFIKADFMSSRYTDGELPAGSVGRDFYIPGLIPVGGSSNNRVFDAHAKQSRFFFTTNTVLESGDRLGSRIEIDFAVPTGGDERQTNTYNPVVRQAFLTWNDWLFGQAWSVFQDVGALPESADFIGPTEGTVFVRQAQIRYTSGPWQFALENPETTLTPFGGGARIVTDDVQVPDVTARYTHRGDWGYFSAAGLLRQLRIDNPGIKSSSTGYGLSLSGRFNVGERNDIRWMLTGGSGIGRYLALNFAEDGILDATGSIEELDVISGFIAYRHVWSDPKWRTNFILARMEIDNPAFAPGGANKRAESARINLMYSPVPRLDFGVELSHAKRTLESGASGEMSRLHFMSRYNF